MIIRSGAKLTYPFLMSTFHLEPILSNLLDSHRWLGVFAHHQMILARDVKQKQHVICRFTSLCIL